MKLLRFLSGLAAIGAATVLMHGSAQVSTMRVVELQVGPIAVNQQASNVALALSVEFPTVGAAYRPGNRLYVHTNKYLGYWDNGTCYAYLDDRTGVPLGGEYFYRTGPTDSDGYCNTAGGSTGYSGNLLNFAATSSIDLLRFALTGGNRVADTGLTTVVDGATTSSEAFTVLGRAYLRAGWLHNDNNFPGKIVPASLEGKVTPDFPDSDTLPINIGSCDDKIWFGRGTSTNCNNPGVAGNLNQARVVPGTTSTQVVTAGTPVTTPTWTLVGTTVTYALSGATTTVAPSVGPISSGTYVAFGSGTTTIAPPGIPVATTFLYNSYVLNGLTSTTAPTAPIPTTVAGTRAVPFATRVYSSIAPTSGPFRVLSIPSGSNPQVCRASATTTTDFRGRLNTSSGAIDDVPSGACGSGAFAGYGTRNRTAVAPVINRPVTVYEPMNEQTFYSLYNTVPVYREATLEVYYNVYTATNQDVYEVAGTTAPGLMFARVRVCDGAEATSRSDLCFRYPNGIYKPIGEIQKKSSGLRVAAFGYVMDDNRPRYGGVLRAPMRYTGPSFRDESGAVQTNSQAEWDPNTGVFITDPLGASPTFARSGVINYLNKFGSTGVYKTYDPVGELYYEALRYFQGLAPTAAATGTLTAAMYDNFPLYSTAASGTGTFAGWTDPVQNACQRRNFILTIGDVNTHNDRQLPGHGGTGALAGSTDDPARSVEPLLGTSTVSFDATYWTKVVGKFEANQSFTYTDALNRQQNTAGNPNPRAGLNNLESRNTGATAAAYYFAGAAYWANTQPIRHDVKGGESMKEVRVKSFFIDVDEYGDGTIRPDRTYYLAGKYGWFRDPQTNGHPFRNAGGVMNNLKWDATSAGSPDGYVVASQAQKMIDGIRTFFEAASAERGALSVSALSSQRYTTSAKNGDLFAPSFNGFDWSGTIQRTATTLNTTAQTIDAEDSVIWDANRILSVASEASAAATLTESYVRPADRKIFSYSRDGASPKGVVFSVADKGQLDTAVQDALDKNPISGTADGLIDDRINWLRGDRSKEAGATGGTLRVRPSGVMGDIINSGPVFKQEADPTVSGAGYANFVSSVSSRTATVYVGANDGMLHAFRASDGKELFGYVPRAVSERLNQLTHPAYVKKAYVDGIPYVREAYTGSEWKTVLVSGMGGGAQGVFALDVTKPTEFDATKVMFEFTDKDDPDMGNVLGQPKIVKLRMPSGAYKWFVAVGSGYNNYQNDGFASTTGEQAMFFLSLEKPVTTPWTLNTNYFKVKVPSLDTNKENALTNPGFTEGSFGEVSVVYAGDLQGGLWRMDLTAGLNASNTANAVVKSAGSAIPMFRARDPSNGLQPITVSPLVMPGITGGTMVVFGTGKFVEPGDADDAQVQTMYGFLDAGSITASDHDQNRSNMFQRTQTSGPSGISVSGAATFAFGSGSGQKRGWYWDLGATRERISVEGVVGFGFVAYNSTLPTDRCQGDGSSVSYVFNPFYGTMVQPGRLIADRGFASKPNAVEMYFTDTDNFSARSNTGARTLTVSSGALSQLNKLVDGSAQIDTSAAVVQSTVAGRISWREVSDVNK